MDETNNSLKEIDVPLNAIEAFLNVRDSGRTNMFDSNAVLYIMFELNYHEAVSWLSELHGDKVKCNRNKYIALIRAVSDHLVITAQL